MNSRTDNSTDVNPEICEYIRQGRMPFTLHAYLSWQAATHVKETLKTAEAQSTLTPQQAFEFMRDQAQAHAQDTLQNMIETSPYLPNLLKDQVENPEAWMQQAAVRPTETALVELRTEFTTRYGFPIITPEAVDELAKLLTGRQVLEVGAGNGYLAQQLQQAGVDLFPTDPHHPASSSYALGKTQHTAVIQADAKQAIREFPEMDLLWSWPCRDEASGLAQQSSQAQLLVYIGEQDNGCTGGELFHQVLEDRFKPVRTIHIPSFPNVHDSIGIYRRT